MRLLWWKLTAWLAGRHRITGPESNEAVKQWFFTGPEMRVKDRNFSQAFRERANAPRP